MKIEMGESLMQSYLKHVKGCLITQTNWKTSLSFKALGFDKAKSVYDKILRHSDFYDVFKNISIEQAFKQAELDVIGISSKMLYMVEVAFHENGLQYGDKTETKDRVCKKLLRAYLVGLAFFPDFDYKIIFASPKVNPATDSIIREYFSILSKYFGSDEKVNFHYIANDDFKNKVLIPTLEKSKIDSVTSELFLRSSKMIEMFGMLDLTQTTVKSNIPSCSQGI